jgi:hypothetical protein
MKNAYVSGVYGKGKDDPQNIDYSAVARPGIGQGAAILFVGKKTDKTLLGIGKLTNSDGGGTPTEITANTRSVTFTVAAIECGVDSNDAKNSFFTNYSNLSVNPQSAATAREAVSIKGKQFPEFKLRENEITRAVYGFRLYGGEDDIDDYGIILANSAEYMKKQPRYPVSGGGFQYHSLRLDEKTVITPENNTTRGYRFENPLEFNFDTTHGTISGSVFALIFQVPVYPLALGTDSGTWYIRASYDSYWLDLDGNGTGGPGGSGGAVLIGTGKFGETSNYHIVLIRVPTKWRYGPESGTNAVPDGYKFLVDGMLVQMQDSYDVPLRYIAYEELTFFTGGHQLSPGWSSQPPSLAGLLPPHDNPSLYPPDVVTFDGPPTEVSSEFYGIAIIKVVFIDPVTFIEYEVSFPILINGGIPERNFTDINFNQTIHFLSNHSADGSTVNNWLNNNLFTQPGGAPGGTYLIIFDYPVDLNSIHLEQNPTPSVNANKLIIILAGRSDVIIGRAGTNSGQKAFQDFSRRAGFYLGTWPFPQFLPPIRTYNNGTLGTETLGTTYNYTINAGGSHTSSATVAPPSDAVLEGDTSSEFFFSSGHGGRLFDVEIGKSSGTNEVSVLNPEWLY